MKIHVGKIVNEILLNQNLTKTSFANKLHYSKQNINALLKKESWNSDTILRSSIILNVNIFEILATMVSKKTENTSSGKIKIKFDKKEIETLKKEISYLKEISSLLRDKI